MNKSARYGSGIETQVLEDIYELTYKLQMLNQEEKRGDYGLPQSLPDRAYIEKSKIETQLSKKLSEVHERMVEVYDDWISDHAPDPSHFSEQAYEYWGERRYEAEHGYGHLGDVADLFGDNDVLETVVEFVQDLRSEEEEEEEVEEEDPYDAWIKYLDSIKAKKAQQQEFEFMESPEFVPTEVEEVEPEKPLEEMTIEELAELEEVKENLSDVLDEIEKQNYFDTFIEWQIEAEQEQFEDDGPYADVKEMRSAMDEWDSLSLSDRIILFQEALTTMHNSGEMAQYLLDDENAVEILNQLSAGPHVEEWDYDLSKMLGYPLGSKLAPTQEWFVPAALKHLAAAILALERPGETITPEDLKQIYEGTYKLQMLDQEEQLGEYGLPKQLPDRAYIEKSRVETQLAKKLDEVYSSVIEAYDYWISIHDYPIDWAVEQVQQFWKNEIRFSIEDQYQGLNLIFSILDRDEVMGTIREFIKEKIAQGDDTLVSVLEYAGKSLEEIAYEDVSEALAPYTSELLDRIEQEEYFVRSLADEAEKDLQDEHEGSALGAIKQMRAALDEWNQQDISGKIILFQEALTTMHNNSEMANYIIKHQAPIQLLNELSQGPDVPQWDYDLTKLLGHPPGSTIAPKEQQWFTPASLRGISRVIAMLTGGGMEKVAVIRKCKKGDSEEGKPWCLYTHDGSRLLGRHPSKESAVKQEQAIKAQGRLAKVIAVLR